MKKQVVVIHGGSAFTPNQKCLERLATKNATADDFKIRNGWKENLQNDLGSGFEVFNPRMPNGQDAKYQEWRIWFEKMFPFLSDEVLLVGHSLGGLFLLKYLSETVFPKKIKALVTVAAPYEGREGKHAKNSNFFFSENFANIEKQAENISLFHSKDDKIVPFNDFEIYKQKLPNAKVFYFEDKGHFNINLIPELIEIINSK